MPSQICLQRFSSSAETKFEQERAHMLLRCLLFPILRRCGKRLLIVVYWHTHRAEPHFAANVECECSYAKKCFIRCGHSQWSECFVTSFVSLLLFFVYVCACVCVCVGVCVCVCVVGWRCRRRKRY